MEKKENKDGEELTAKKSSLLDLLLNQQLEAIKEIENIILPILAKGVSIVDFMKLLNENNCKLSGLKSQKYGLMIFVELKSRAFLKPEPIIKIFNGEKIKLKLSDLSIEEAFGFIERNAGEIILKSFDRKDKEGKYFRFFEIPKIEKEEKESLVKKSKYKMFQQIKTSISPLGDSFAFCRYKGKGVIVEKGIIEYFNLSFGNKNYKIDINQTVLIQTNKEGVLKLLLKVAPKSWGQLEQLKRMMKKGVSLDDINLFVKDSVFELKDIKGKYGQYVAISPSSIFDYNESHQVNIYPGNSVKSEVIELDSLIDFSNKNKDRIVFKSFNKEESVYYRFYLRKTKTVIKAKAEIAKAEKDI